MQKIKARIVCDTKVVVFQPSQNSASYPADKGSPLLKRRAPRLPRQKPKQTHKDD